MSRDVDNSQDVLDSRDVIARIEELESEVADLEEQENFDSLKAKQENAELYDELANLKALAEEGENSSDWAHGETLVRDSYWTDYVREMLEDCGTIPKDLPGWVVLDWDATAENVKADYTEIDFDGETYWIRDC